jgi:hypothetical protein
MGSQKVWQHTLHALIAAAATPAPAANNSRHTFHVASQQQRKSLKRQDG